MENSSQTQTELEKMKSKSHKNIINTVINKDARTIETSLPSSIQISTTITSPPYFDMKDYDSENQIGYGQTYENYLNDLKLIFKNILKITKEDGSLWIIIDTFKRNNQVVTLPFDLTNKLKEIGWLLQDVIIWKKDKTVPWSNNGFMQRKFEYILFLTKSTKFKSRRDEVRVYDTAHLKHWWIKYPERYNPKGKALDEVWEFAIPTQGSWGKKYIRHFCPLPQDMVATMIHLSSDEKDIVFDPFAGSGTVMSQSAYMNRNYLGFELNQNYIDKFQKYLAGTLKQGRKEYNQSLKSMSQSEFEKTILNLRALKYARLILKSVEKKINSKEFKILVTTKRFGGQNNKLLKVQYDFIGIADDSNLLIHLEDISKKKPLSKFGIEPVFKLSKQQSLSVTAYAVYSSSNTHFNIEDKKQKIEKGRIFSKIRISINENDYS